MHWGSGQRKRGESRSGHGNLCVTAPLQASDPATEDGMSNLSYRSSQPDAWSKPRPCPDASQRFMTYGKLMPMEQPGFWQRLFGGR